MTYREELMMYKSSMPLSFSDGDFQEALVNSVFSSTDLIKHEVVLPKECEGKMTLEGWQKAVGIMENNEYKEKIESAMAEAAVDMLDDQHRMKRIDILDNQHKIKKGK